LIHRRRRRQPAPRLADGFQPVLIGSGVTLFHEMTRQIDLKLPECRPFRNGCVLV
jgi:hypothetical protein